ncbi:hypothetical protein B0H14DRAFT_3440631 [Mycena olivaceomarginata]|nr:hypothetical protein B0H14DRAFT_3440631 [Mycena olivaceomarginata]
MRRTTNRVPLQSQAHGARLRRRIIGPPERSAARPPKVTASKEKEASFRALKDRTLWAASFDELAIAPTAACLDALDTFQARLDGHHEFPWEEETTESFSALLTKSVISPIHILTAQLQAQHQAIQSLSKSVDSVKTAHVTTKSYASTDGSAPDVARSPPMPKSLPITSTPDERILPRCDGDTPPSFSLHFNELIPQVNAVLTPLGLPKITYASRSKDGGLFLLPESKEATSVLVKAWSTWSSGVFPGARIVPPAI